MICNAVHNAFLNT